MPVTVKKAKARTTNTGSGPAQASLTEIVTHVAQHDVIGRNMARLRWCAFDMPVKETHRLAAMGRARPFHEGDRALRALGGWVAHRVAIPSGGADAIFRRCGISRTHRGPSGRPLGERARYRAVAPRLGCPFSDRLGHRRGAPRFEQSLELELVSRTIRGLPDRAAGGVGPPL